MRGFMVAALLALSACGAGGYPPQYESNFMHSCQAGGSDEARCACMWGHIKSEIPRADFEAADRAIQTGTPHPAVEQLKAISDQCSAAP